MKGSGGCIGLSENPVAFRCWMLSGPELARLQRQFEEEYLPDTKLGYQHFQNHEQGHATQKASLKLVTSLFKTIQRMGNPFLDDFPELVTLDSRNCVDESVSIALYAMEETGKKKYKDYVKRVLEDRTSHIHDPIKKNSLALYRRPQPKAISKQGKKIKTLQNNVALFSKLYISMQSREGDLREFFAHEIQVFPPSLSNLGKLYLPASKSEILNCIEQPEVPAPPSMYDCTVLDGAVIVHILSTKAMSTFNEYAEQVFIPYLIDQLQSSTRIDVVWDTYIADSLKESTREKRGKGLHRSQTKLPSNWMDFLRDSTNKKELFAFLTSKVVEFTFPPNKAVYITSGESVVSLGLNSAAMLDCNHEEADTRIVVHLLHALEHGYENN